MRPRALRGVGTGDAGHVGLQRRQHVVDHRAVGRPTSCARRRPSGARRAPSPRPAPSRAGRTRTPAVEVAGARPRPRGRRSAPPIVAAVSSDGRSRSRASSTAKIGSAMPMATSLRPILAGPLGARCAGRSEQEHERAGRERVTGAGRDRRQREAVQPHEQPGAGDDELPHASVLSVIVGQVEAGRERPGRPVHHDRPRVGLGPVERLVRGARAWRGRWRWPCRRRG